MNRCRSATTSLLLLCVWASTSVGQYRPLPHVAERRPRLRGTILDFTGNRDLRNRLFCASLAEYRDLYVYLPPGYSRERIYPFLIWLHGFSTDERVFACHLAPIMDELIASGRIPPLVAVAPDGSVRSRLLFVGAGSWYVNSQHGRYADYVRKDVVEFMERNFSITRQRYGRALAGFSMGGFGAFSLGMENPDLFGIIAGISPCLNLRYIGLQGRYLDEYQPGQWRLRSSFNPFEVVGSYYCGLLKIRTWQLYAALADNACEATKLAAKHNPLELLTRDEVQRARQRYYIAYGEQDEMNIDAQVQSFIEVANKHGIELDVRVYRRGRHSIAFMVEAFPELMVWLGAQFQRDQAPAAGQLADGSAGTVPRRTAGCPDRPGPR